MDASLRANRGARIADGALAELRRRVELFGFHIAKLDVRVHANQLEAPDERTHETFRAVRAARTRHGARALDTVIVSGTAGPADILRALHMARRRTARTSRSSRCSRRSPTCGGLRRR